MHLFYFRHEISVIFYDGSNCSNDTGIVVVTSFFIYTINDIQYKHYIFARFNFIFFSLIVFPVAIILLPTADEETFYIII